MHDQVNCKCDVDTFLTRHKLSAYPVVFHRLGHENKTLIVCTSGHPILLTLPHLEIESFEIGRAHV